MVATLKPYRVGLVGLIVGASMLFSSSNAYAETAFTTVTCANPQGEQIQRQIGWDNSNAYFADKGNIPQHYCEGGFAGPYTTYIGDDLPADSPLRWYAGIAPTPEPTRTPSVTIEPTPMPTAEPEPSPTPSLAPSPEPTPSAPSLAPVVPTEPPSTQTPESTPTPEPEPTPTAIVETPEPTAEPSPTPIEPSPVPSPIPSLDPQVVALEVPTQLMAIPGIEELAKAVENIMNIGSDMTPEQREESQQVAVAAVLVTQIASNLRRLK